MWQPKHDGRINRLIIRVTHSVVEELPLHRLPSFKGLFDAFILTASWQYFYLPEQVQLEVWSLFCCEVKFSVRLLVVLVFSQLRPSSCV